MSELEKSIIRSVNEGLSDAIRAQLSRDYHNGPLSQLVNEVVKSRSAQLRLLIEESVDGALTGDFRSALQEAVTHKLARILTSKIEGEIERRANDLRSSPEFRAKLTLAIEKAVKEASTP